MPKNVCTYMTNFFLSDPVKQIANRAHVEDIRMSGYGGLVGVAKVMWEQH